jgi:uncharacterized membrane protein
MSKGQSQLSYPGVNSYRKFEQPVLAARWLNLFLSPHRLPLASVGIIAVAALFATTAESLIGATAQGSVWFLTNEVVNFILTVIGGAAAMALRKCI